MKIHDKYFDIYIPEKEIQHRVQLLAKALYETYGTLNPLFLIILNGAFIFGADLLRHFNAPCEISFTKVSSYTGLQGGDITTFTGITTAISGRHIILVEDIIDSGNTVHYLQAEIKKLQAASLHTVALLQKKIERKNLIHADSVGFEIEDRFVVGYGMDYNELGRNLKDIFILSA